MTSSTLVYYKLTLQLKHMMYLQIRIDSSNIAQSNISKQLISEVSLLRLVVGRGGLEDNTEVTTQPPDDNVSYWVQ